MIWMATPVESPIFEVRLVPAWSPFSSTHTFQCWVRGPDRFDSYIAKKVRARWYTLVPIAADVFLIDMNIVVWSLKLVVSYYFSTSLFFSQLFLKISLPRISAAVIFGIEFESSILIIS